MAQYEDPRRRGTAGGGGTIGMPDPGQFQSLTGGVPQWDYSGPMGRDFAAGGPQGGGGGLLSLLAQGPSGRHFGRQGFAPQGLPFLNDLNPIGGPNIAPGNMETGQALGQPGVPPGVARGISGAMPPGQMRPQTQGWRNLAPGYGVEAFYQGFRGQPGAGGGGTNRGIPSTGTAETPGVGNKRPSGGGGGGTQDRRAAGTGVTGRTGPRPGPASGGTGQGPTGKPSNKGAPGGVTPEVKRQAGQQSTVRGGGVPVNTTAPVDKGPGGKPKINPKTGGVTSQGQPTFQGPTANGPSTEVFVPNKGNNNTPSETKYNTTPVKKKGAVASVGKKKSTGNSGRTSFQRGQR